jgi:hypothetical protein
MNMKTSPEDVGLAAITLGQNERFRSAVLRREIDRCQREIGAAEAALLAGQPDVVGLCLALSDWSAELRILCEAQQGVSNEHDK